MEVEGEVVGGGDEDHAVDGDDEEAGAGGALAEDGEGHDGVFADFPLDEDEDAKGYDAEDDETEDDGRVPGVGDAAVFDAKEEHKGCANYGERSEPVDGFETFEDGGLGGLDIEEEEYDEECDAVKRKVDVEAPSPGDALGESASDDGTDGRRKGPYHTNDAVVCTTITKTE